jgi:histone-lysine N-methyltransferase EZH2
MVLQNKISCTHFFFFSFNRLIWTCKESFPEKGTHIDLKEKYCQLKRLKEQPMDRNANKISQNNIMSKPVVGGDCTPNIDNPNEVILASREQTLHSFHTLFCRRCYKYDCFLHKYKQPLPINNVNYNKAKKSENLKFSDKPCSPDCYKSVQQSPTSTKTSPKNNSNRRNSKPLSNANTPSSPENGMKTRSTSRSPLSLRPDSKLTADLNSAEESLYKVFANIFEKNSCALARIIRTKTCVQLRLFIDSIDNKASDDDTGVIKEYSPNGTHHQRLHNDSKSAPNETHETKRRGKRSGRLTNPKKKVKLRKLHFLARKLHEASAAHTSNLDIVCDADDGSMYNYNACDHPGLPCNEDCKCVRNKNFCEKFCQCSIDCVNRFRGCKCRSQCNSKHCDCFLAVRECDPNLCHSCGASDNFKSKKLQTGSCCNIAIQRGLRKHLLLAPSEIAGWGIYLKEKCLKNEFIAEYCGEIISQDEADRRGKVYDKYKCSFLFNLNNDFVVDATRKGNKIRFANHSVNPNCYAKVMFVNGDHRIGIFAKRDIDLGEELFFDYRYGPMEQLKFVGIERPSQNPV